MSWMDSLGKAAKPGKDLSGEERRKIAGDLVNVSSLGAAAATLVPLPGSDFVVVTSVQASMVAAVGRVYGRELTLRQGRELLMELAAVCGLGLVAQKGFATLTKILLPGWGGVLAGPYAFAVTYGMGHAAMSYFENRDLTRETMKRVYDEAVAEGKRIFSRGKLDEFRKKKGAEVEEFAREQARAQGGGGEEPRAPKPRKAKATRKRTPARKKAARPRRPAR